MPPRTPPGETRERVYRFVRDQLLRGGAPTTREVQEAFGFRAVQTAREHLERLVAEGRLGKRYPRVASSTGITKARGYCLPEQGHGQSGKQSAKSVFVDWVPLLGRVHAGGLHAAIADSGFDERIPVSGLGSTDEHFALTVVGDSMIDAGILSGDIVIARVQPTARTGDIVVAMIEGPDTVEPEATVKRLRRKGRRVELHPENPDYEVIVPSAGSEMVILGKVIEVRRTF